MNRKTLFALSLITLAASLSPSGHAQTFGVIHEFDLQVEGAFPVAGVTWSGDVLYGTTPSANQASYGNVYQITHLGSDFTYTSLFFFPSDWSGGIAPRAGVVFGPDGHLYGTTEGGPRMPNAGVVFDLLPPTSPCRTPPCSLTENLLYTFMGQPDGAFPDYGNLIWDEQGNIYGSTSNGGPRNVGTVFKMTKSGNTWAETPIWAFSYGPDGAFPEGGVVLDNSGNLIGTTSGGGTYGYGVVFRLSYINGSWVETRLYNFQGGSDGGEPYGGLIFDKSGDLYGTTTYGGSAGGGTVFELMPSDNPRAPYSFKLLYSFTGTVGQRGGPSAALAMDEAGNLYGTTGDDGEYLAGNVFKLTNTPNGWVYASLHDFTGGQDGGYPWSKVTIAPDGNLYGTTEFGGYTQSYLCQNMGCGTVRMIKP